jgi:hypothetical protein
MNIIDGDIIQIREERYSADGVVVGTEQGTDWEGKPETFVIVDFGNPQPGRIPMHRFADCPDTLHHIKTV